MPHLRLTGLAPETTSGVGRLIAGAGEIVTGLGFALADFRGWPDAGTVAACRFDGLSMACGVTGLNCGGACPWGNVGFQAFVV